MGELDKICRSYRMSEPSFCTRGCVSRQQRESPPSYVFSDFRHALRSCWAGQSIYRTSPRSADSSVARGHLRITLGTARHVPALPTWISLCRFSVLGSGTCEFLCRVERWRVGGVPFNNGRPRRGLRVGIGSAPSALPIKDGIRSGLAAGDRVFTEGCPLIRLPAGARHGSAWAGSKWGHFGPLSRWGPVPGTFSRARR